MAEAKETDEDSFYVRYVYPLEHVHIGIAYTMMFSINEYVLMNSF